MYKNLVTSFIRQWKFVRKETIEILNSLTDEQLQFLPKGEKWQPLFFQFSCIGRTQLIYTEAVKTGVMDFSLFGSKTLPKKTDYQTKVALVKFLQKTDQEWMKAIRTQRSDEDFVIKWPGFSQPLTTHIASLENHERLHHGQLISYFTLAGFALPQEFKTNWAL